jgi:phosphate transport system substrate-binding protein
MNRILKRLAVGVIAAASVVTVAVAANISGAGATFPFPLYSKWAAAYRAQSGIGLNYQSIGSGGGIKQIKARTVTFGATDKPLTAAELNAAGLIQFPTVIGGDVPVVNVAGIKPGQLILDGPTLANIFLGKIGKWNDPAIVKLNPGVNLPNQAIVVVHRSDGSGTTYIFAHYLSKVSREWNDRVGADTAVDWPVGIGAKGNEGVAGNVSQTSGSIGYVEYAYAKQNRLAHTRMINRDGKIVSPSIQSFQAAAATANWAGTPGFGLMLTNQAGADAWPMAGATFILMYKQPSDAAASNTALKFFKWAYASGDTLATGLDYVPLPENVVQQVEASWKQVQGWTGS